MQEPLAELAAYSGPWYQVPDGDLVRLTAAARAAGHRWDVIEAACDKGPGKDIPAVIRQQYWFTPLAGPGLFGATQRAARNLTGRDVGGYPPLTWPCPGCGQQITDLAACGRPIYAELGHVAGCARLSRDQTADEALRRTGCPGSSCTQKTRSVPCSGTGWPGRSSMTARAAAGTAISTVTWSPSTATGPARSATIATRICTRISRSR
jgi:hypothetical protein